MTIIYIISIIIGIIVCIAISFCVWLRLYTDYKSPKCPKYGTTMQFEDNEIDSGERFSITDGSKHKKLGYPPGL